LRTVADFDGIGDGPLLGIDQRHRRTAVVGDEGGVVEL
jgi:hypothetical protein